MTCTIALEIEYNGARFHGFQLQPVVRTVQSELQRVLTVATREPVTSIHCSGRTDAGVHARGQIVSFRVSTEPDLERLALAVSGLLKGEVAVRKAAVMPFDFHPRAGVVSKTYEYRIIHRRTPLVHDYGYAWHVPVPLNVGTMQSQARSFLGTHDFTSFRAAGCANRSPIKRIDAFEITRQNEAILISVTGSGFLKQMVRTMVGTLVLLGKGGKLVSEDGGEIGVAQLIGLRDRTKAGPTAPAHGLILASVRYREWPAVKEWQAAW